MPSSVICCDANLVVRLATGIDATVDLIELGDRWSDENRSFVAPQLFRYELVNAFHRLGVLRVGTHEMRRRWLEEALEFPVQLDTGRYQHVAAFELAARYRLPASYDAHYLAVAIEHQTELWIGDKRLFNSVRRHLDWVHHVA